MSYVNVHLVKMLAECFCMGLSMHACGYIIGIVLYYTSIHGLQVCRAALLEMKCGGTRAQVIGAH